jgi:taurine transport system permease protein
MDEEPLEIWTVAVIGAIAVVVFLTAWEVVVRVGVIDAFFLPAPSMIIKRAYAMAAVGERILITDIWKSATRVLIGFLLSAAVGVPLGLVMGMSKYVRAALNPIVSIIRPLPALSWIPLSMLWLGIGEKQKFAIVFMGCFASVLVYTVAASRLQVIRHVTLPGALPNILSGLKVVLAIAWTCVISAEMVGANSGLGFRIWTGKEWSDTGQVLVGMISISLTVLILDIVFRGVEWLLLPWQREGTGT